jgi:nucleolin
LQDGTGAAAKAQQQPAAAAQDAGELHSVDAAGAVLNMLNVTLLCEPAGAGAAGSKRKAADADGIEPAAAAAGPQGDADPSEAKLTKQEKKRLKQERKARERAEQQQQAYGAHSAADTTSDQQQQPGGSNADADPAAAAAANTEEAQHIRSVLGFQGPAVNHSTGNFSFDFYAAVERETQEKLARIMAGDGSSKKHKKQQQQQQQQQQLPPPPKAAPVEAPAPAVAAAGSAGPSTAAPAAAGPGGYVPRRVFVGGMPYHYTEDKIREYWGWCGEVESIDLMTFPDSGRFRGIAFITFADEDGFHAALSCNGENLEGQTLKVGHWVG